MFVQTFPELGTVPTNPSSNYGLVAVGFTNNSLNIGMGVPGGGPVFALFVNLYYYYDQSLYPDPWPDNCGQRPITSGWMMPRNVFNDCPSQQPPSTAPVSGIGRSTSGQPSSFVSGAA